MGNKEEVKIIRKRNQWQDEWWEPKQKKHDCMMLVTMVTTIQLLACIYIWHCIFIFSTPIFFLHVYAAAGMRQEESFKTFCESVKRHGVFFFWFFSPPPDFTSRSQVREKWEKQTWRIKCWWKMSLVIEQIWGDLWCRCRKYFIDSLYFMHYWQ